MTYSKQLVESLMHEKKWSQYRAAKELGVTPQYINKIRKSDSNNQVSNELARKIAVLLGYNPTDVLLRLAEDKAETQEERQIWGKLLMSSAAAIMVAVTTVNNELTNCAQCILC